MPFLGEFTNYADWEIDAPRWARTLRNRSVSTGLDYYVNNSKEIETSEIDTNAAGFLKRKVEGKVAENGKSIIKWGKLRTGRL